MTDVPHATWREVYAAMGVDPDGHETTRRDD
jgi:hypothetical protein